MDILDFNEEELFDIKPWELIAFTWISDAVGEVERGLEWVRFCEAYPEYALETVEEFWERIHRTHWHKHHHHHHHHHHPY